VFDTASASISVKLAQLEGQLLTREMQLTRELGSSEAVTHAPCVIIGERSAESLQ
jgi:hypothetical protein